MVVYISRRVVLPLLLWHSHLIRSRAFAFSSSAASAVASSASRSSVANMIRDVQWIDLQVPPAELRPQFTLTNGQCFNWRPLDTAGESDAVWVGVVAGRALAIRQSPSTTSVACLGGDNDAQLQEDMHDYFQFKQELGALYARWSSPDARMRTILTSLPGVRILRQDPWECLLSFICSSNNNIARITTMLDRIRRCYGNHICSIHRGADGEWDVVQAPQKRLSVSELMAEGTKQSDVIHFHTFPTPHQLAAATEQDLRTLGLGYRASYIYKTTQQVLQFGLDWLHGLRQATRQDAQQELMKLTGVGMKVADCVALFSLDQASTVPIDTHVWRIATRDYDPSLKAVKSLTPAVYERVGEIFRAQFGSHAGWAHSALFTAELTEFQAYLPRSMVEEMQNFRQAGKAEKATTKRKTTTRTIDAKVASSIQTGTRSSRSNTAKKLKAEVSETTVPVKPAVRSRQTRKRI